MSALVALSSSASAWAAGEARGLVRSLGEAVLSSEIPGRIIKMPFREGQTFAAGEILIAFDCEGNRANAAAARAELRAAVIGLESTRELLRAKAAGQRDLETAEARRDRAAAELEVLEVRLKSCEIVAPFAGAVVERGANEYEVIAPASPLMRIVDVERLEIELIISSASLAVIAPGTVFDFRVDEMAKSYQARVVRLGAVVDPASQTTKIFAVFENDHAGVLQGMSGTAYFSAPKAAQ